MNGTLLVAVLAPVVATAWLLDATRRRLPMPAVLRYGLALGLGVNLSAAWFFAARAAHLGPIGVVAGDATLLAVAALARWRLARLRFPPATSWNPLQRRLLVAVAIAAAAAAAAFTINATEHPHGQWDAWAIWNVRARALARGAALPFAFSASLQHADYPPLWPSAVARAWALAGESPAAPLFLAAALATATGLILFGAISALRDRTLALLAVLCLLGTPHFVSTIAWQYADIPLSFAMLAALALLVLRDHDPARGRGISVWAGIAAGSAALTKNEGILFVAVLLIIETMRATRHREARRAWIAFLVGLAPAVVLLGTFKLLLAPPSYLLADQSLASYGARLLDPTRYAAVLRAVADALVPFGGALLLALAAAALLLGAAPERPTRRAAAHSAAVVALVAAGYGAVYLLTPTDLAWQLRSSIERLMLQLWPSALFTLFLALRSPDDCRAPHRLSGRRPQRRR